MDRLKDLKSAISEDDLHKCSKEVSVMWCVGVDALLKQCICVDVLWHGVMLPVVVCCRLLWSVIVCGGGVMCGDEYAQVEAVTEAKIKAVDAEVKAKEKDIMS
jgi:hypothetical protein